MSGASRKGRLLAGTGMAVLALGAALAAGEEKTGRLTRFNEASGYVLRLGVDAARQRKAESDVRLARAAFLPKVTVGGDWVLDGSTTYHPQRIVDADPDSYPTKDPSIVAIEASLVVYDGSRRMNLLKAADAFASAGRAVSLDTRQQLFLESANVELAVIRDRAIVEKRRAVVKALRRTLQIAREMIVDQSVTLTDVALATARVEKAEAELQGAIGDLETSEIAYGKLLGHGPSRSLSLREPEARLPRSAGEAATRAEAGAPGLSAARDVAYAAEFKVDAVKSSFYPTVEVVGRASASLEPSPVIDEVDSYTALLRLRMPLFDPTLKPALDGARAEAEQKRYEAASARLETAASARSLFAERQAMSLQARALGRQINQSRAVVKGMRIEQELGTRTINDILDSQTSLAEAEIVAARLDFERRRLSFALLATMGELAEADVAAPSRPAS